MRQKFKTLFKSSSFIIVFYVIPFLPVIIAFSHGLE